MQLTGLSVETSCADDTSNDLCRFVEKVTGSDTAADWVHIVIAKPGAIVGLILIGIVLRALLARVIDRLASRAAEGTVPGVLQNSKARQMFLETSSVAVERRKQRSATMASLLKSVSTGVIFTIVAFMVIAQLGYNIAPLIASAGIIGVALGFGAQSLVKDFLSGIFMILEDQYGVGDVINLDGTATGTVEAVGLRVTRVRDVDGTVWYVRNGEILAVGNMSQNWARSVLDVPVGYHEDLDRVRTVLRDVAHELVSDPDYEALILEEPEVWGAERIDPEAVVMRVVIKTAPMEQWGVTRELRERVKARFDSLGIEIPLPQRVVTQRAVGAEPTPETVAEP